MTLLPLTKAQEIVDAVLAESRRLNLEPITVSVLDASGTLKAMAREDGSSLARPDLAFSKAWGAIGMGLPSRELNRRSELMPAFFNALNNVTQGKVVPMPGGVLILSGDTVVGSVGVSGDTSDNDELAAIAGVRAAGFTVDFEATPQVRKSQF
jgi:uncharacterized protein GlcG (DUF336 family)